MIFRRSSHKGDGARSSASRRPTTHTAKIPDGLRVFAFGDVHGRSDLLAELIRRIENELAMSPGAESILIGLGDYVDRGADSKGVLDLLVSRELPLEVRPLKGNHEAMFEDFLEEPAEFGGHWFRNGGWETVRSYGVDCVPIVTPPSRFVRIRDELVEKMPTSHLSFIEALPLTASYGDYFFVHAGARPGVALSEASEDDALWIRGGFSDRDDPFEQIVVHGHTPTELVFVGQYRINLDTGAYATGRLTCLVLEGHMRRFIEVTG